jgi:hypothetical protein
MNKRARFVALGLALLFSACAAKKAGPKPAWLDARPAADDQSLYGYGCAEPKIDNWTFKRQTADERARVNLAQNLHAYVLEQVREEPAARRVIEKVLPDYAIVDRYTDHAGNLCARAALPKTELDAAIFAELHPPHRG